MTEERIQHPAPDDFRTPEERHRRDLARTFERRDDYERLIRLQASAAGGNVPARDELTSILSPTARMSLGFYSNARDAAVAEGLIDSATGASR